MSCSTMSKQQNYCKLSNQYETKQSIFFTVDFGSHAKQAGSYSVWTIQYRCVIFWPNELVFLWNNFFLCKCDCQGLRMNLQPCYSTIIATLFSNRSAHENHPNCLRSLGHRPRPWVILILSIGLESNWYIAVKTIWQNQHDPRSGSATQGHRKNWAKSVCTSFGEEHYSILASGKPHVPLLF